MFMRRHLLLCVLILWLVGSESYSSFLLAQPPQEIVRMGRGTVMDARWRPDGEALLVNSSQGVWVYTPDFEPVGHLSNVKAAIFSPDGSSIAGIGMVDGNIVFWNATGTEQLGVIPTDQPLREIAFSPDGEFLAGIALSSSGEFLEGYGFQIVLVWDVATQNIVSNHTTDYEIFHFAWNRAGDQFAVSGVDRVEIFDLETGISYVLDLPENQQRIYKIAWVGDANLLALGAVDDYNAPVNTLQIWDMSTRTLLSIIQAGRVLDLDVHPHDPVLAIATDRYSAITDYATIRVWNPITGELLGETQQFFRNPVSIDWNTAGTQLLAVSADNTARIVSWPVPTPTDQPILQGFGNAVTSLDWNGDGSQIASGHEDGSVRVWETHTGDPVATLLGNREQVWSVDWQPNGENLVSGGGDFMVRTWDLATNTMNPEYQHIPTIFDQIPGVLSVAWSKNGQIASGGSDGVTRIIVPYEGSRLLDETRGTIFSVDWHPTEDKLAVAGGLGQVQLWDTNANQLLHSFNCEEQGIWIDVTISPDGSQVAASNNTGMVCIWDFATQQTTHVLNGLIAPIVWRPGENQITGINSNDSSEVQIWNLENQEMVASLKTDAEVLSMAWNPDGTELATGSQDGIIQIWE